MFGGYRCYNPSVFALLLVPLVRNRQIHEDLGVPSSAEHIRALTASFDSKLVDVGNPQYGNLTDTYADRGLTPSPDAKAKGGRGQQASRGHRPRWPSRLNESRSTLSAERFSDNLTEVFRDFPQL
jgi:hypothetical protein